MLTSADELRHPHTTDDFFWRESLYFNFADADHDLGGWIYLWVTPNKPLKSGMLVAVYHGESPDWDINDQAMASPGHVVRGEGGNWVYCFKQEVPELLDANFDDVELCGLHLQRTEPLARYRITFTDDVGSSLELDAEFLTRPWDYADGVFDTPPWVATNRYHRSWRARGSITIDGTTFPIDTTGDSDHSWGTRDTEEYAQHTFKMWSFQTPDGNRSISAIRRDGGMCFGFLNVDGELGAIEHVTNSARYDPVGVQSELEVEVRDTLGRSVRATMPKMFAVIGHGTKGALWGYEGVGRYETDEWGPCTGISSFFWPARFTGEALHADRSIENP
jgi:hypothetical protein